MPLAANWIAEQLDRGIDVLITNPELVKTGLDLLGFPHDCVHAVGVEHLHVATSRAPVMADRPEAACEGDLPGVCGHVADDVLA